MREAQYHVSCRAFGTARIECAADCIACRVSLSSSLSLICVKPKAYRPVRLAGMDVPCRSRATVSYKKLSVSKFSALYTIPDVANLVGPDRYRHSAAVQIMEASDRLSAEADMLPIEHDARIYPKTQRDPRMVFLIGPVYTSATNRGCDAFDAGMVTASLIAAQIFSPVCAAANRSRQWPRSDGSF